MARTGWLLGCMVVLAGLDLAGALLAQQYAERHHTLALVLGALTFVMLFVVYAFFLEYAQLSIVTMGWVVLLQVGLIAIDLSRTQLHLDRNQALAVLAILALQGYLIMSTQSSPAAAAGPPTAPSATPYLDPGMAPVADAYAPSPGRTA